MSVVGWPHFPHGAGSVSPCLGVEESWKDRVQRRAAGEEVIVVRASHPGLCPGGKGIVEEHPCLGPGSAARVRILQ